MTTTEIATLTGIEYADLVAMSAADFAAAELLALERWDAISDGGRFWSEMAELEDNGKPR
jgi:hypothetical protein